MIFRVNILAKEAFPPEEYLAPSELLKMAQSDNFDFLALLDDAAPNKEQREKRRSFYLRNGYRETGLFLSYLGVDYEVFCMDEYFDIDTFKAMTKTIQVVGFNPRYFTK